MTRYFWGPKPSVRKPVVRTPSKCERCREPIVQKQRGRTPRICQICLGTSPMPIGTNIKTKCKWCKEDFNQAYRGSPRFRKCPECRHTNCRRQPGKHKRCRYCKIKFKYPLFVTSCFHDSRCATPMAKKCSHCGTQITRREGEWLSTYNRRETCFTESCVSARRSLAAHKGNLLRIKWFKIDGKKMSTHEMASKAGCSHDAMLLRLSALHKSPKEAMVMPIRIVPSGINRRKKGYKKLIATGNG